MLDFTVKAFAIQLNVATGPSFYMTDFPLAPGYPDAVNYPLPDWLPKKLFITRISMHREDVSGAFYVTIDKERRAYNSGYPPHHQFGPITPIGTGVPISPGLFDVSLYENILILTPGVQHRVENFWPPKVMDREFDSIWVQCDNTAPTLLGASISYIVPATDQPDDIGWSPGAPPPPPPGVTTVFSTTLDAQASIGVGIAHRSIVPSIAAGGGEVRVRFKALGGGANITHASIGVQDAASDMIAAPVPLTIAGNAAVNLGAGADVYSDWVPLVTQPGDTLLVHVEGFGGIISWAYDSSGAPGNYYQVSSSWDQQAMSNPTFQADRTHWIDQVQVR